MKRLTQVILAVTSLVGIGMGQTAFMQLTPGKSTRIDVERTFGKPVKEHSQTLVEYGPQSQTGRIFVQYGTDSGVVERFEFLCRTQTSSCENLIRSLKLSMSEIGFWDAVHTGDATGKTVRYYNAPLHLVTTVDNESEGSYYSLMPVRIALFSPELYNATLEKNTEDRKIDPPQLTVTSLRFFESDDGSVPLEARSYRRRFSGEGTRYVNYEVTLSYPKNRLGKPITITAVWSRDGPMEPQSRVFNNTYDELFTFKSFSRGIGNMDGRQFSQRRGKWTVEIHIEGQRVATGSFEIY